MKQVDAYVDCSALAEKGQIVGPLHPLILMEDRINNTAVVEKEKVCYRTPSSIISPCPVFNPGEHSLI